MTGVIRLGLRASHGIHSAARALVPPRPSAITRAPRPNGPTARVQAYRAQDGRARANVTIALVLLRRPIRTLQAGSAPAWGTAVGSSSRPHADADVTGSHNQNPKYPRALGHRADRARPLLHQRS